MESGSQMTLGEWMPGVCPGQAAGALDSPVRTSVLQENKVGYPADVQDCFMQLQDLYGNCKKKIDPACYSLKTLKIYCQLIEDMTSAPFSLNWMKSGMMQNGRFSTLRIMESPKIGKGCSLLDILEADVPEKYFLSERQTAYITQPKRMGRYTKLHNA